MTNQNLRGRQNEEGCWRGIFLEVGWPHAFLGRSLARNELVRKLMGWETDREFLPDLTILDHGAAAPHTLRLFLLLLRHELRSHVLERGAKLRLSLPEPRS